MKRVGMLLFASLLLLSVLVFPATSAVEDTMASDGEGIGLLADQPVRDRVIAALTVIALLVTILGAMYHISKKEGL